MTVDTRFATEMFTRLDRVENLSSTSNSKFADFEEWFRSRTERTLAVSYLHGLRRQFTARVGAALLASPDVLVLLSTDPWTTPSSGGGTYLHRLSEVSRYVQSLHAIVACTGREGSWRTEAVVGPPSSDLRARLQLVLIGGGAESS